MLADVVGFDPNITISGLLVMIPATIAAVAALRNGKVNRTIRDEVASTNGTSTGATVQHLKDELTKRGPIIDGLVSGQNLILQNQAIHEELDKARQAATNARITIMDLRLSQNNDHLYEQDHSARAEAGLQQADRDRVITVAQDLATHSEAASAAHEDHLDSQDVTLDELVTATTSIK